MKSPDLKFVRNWITKNILKKADKIIYEFILELNDSVSLKLLDFIDRYRTCFRLEYLFTYYILSAEDLDEFFQSRIRDVNLNISLYYLMEEIIKPIVGRIRQIPNADRVMDKNFPWIYLYGMLEEAVYEKIVFSNLCSQHTTFYYICDSI